MYVLKHFASWEFVPNWIYEKLGNDSLRLINPVILVTADDIRDYFGVPVTINDYLSGGTNEHRGFREATCNEGADLSMHRIGGALDMNIKGVTAEEVRQVIIKNRDRFPYITRMEAGVIWLHVDNKKTRQNKIVLFNKTVEVAV